MNFKLKRPKLMSDVFSRNMVDEEWVSSEERLKRVKLRKGVIGTPEEQEAERKRYRKWMREVNKNAREAGYARGIKQAIEEDGND